MYSRYRIEVGQEDLIVELTKEGASMPRYAETLSNGLDLVTPEDLTIQPGKRITVNTGVKCEFPKFVWGRIEPRSGLANKHGIDVLAGVCDESYRGEIHVILINFGEEEVKIKAGERIAQLVLMPSLRATCKIAKVNMNTERGDGKFGSTGK